MFLYKYIPIYKYTYTLKKKDLQNQALQQIFSIMRIRKGT